MEGSAKIPHIAAKCERMTNIDAPRFKDIENTGTCN